jgi:four helix bundle protein
MTTEKFQAHPLPHHTLVGYGLCLELVRLVASIRIADAQLRQQARKSAASAALNAAEGAARESAGDKRRSYGIASGEACEACAAVEIAGALGACSPANVQSVLALALRIRRVFSPLVR